MFAMSQTMDEVPVPTLETLSVTLEAIYQDVKELKGERDDGTTKRVLEVTLHRSLIKFGIDCFLLGVIGTCVFAWIYETIRRF